MNQIFRITVGPETIHGRLPACRVGRCYSSLFHVAGVSPDIEPPKVWINVVTPGVGDAPDTTEVLYWTGEWSNTLGLWVIGVNSDPTQKTGTVPYALTVGGGDGTPEYIIGQGTFTVYDNIAAGGGCSGGDPGESLASLVAALTERVEELEARWSAMMELPMFDPQAAFDIDMRNQVQAITNILRGTP